MKSDTIYSIGIDVGSTTLKVVVLNELNELLYKVYKRHKADFNTLFVEELRHVMSRFPDARFTVAITGSAGMGISERTGLLYRK